MKRIAILTDSACDLPFNLLEKLGNVWVVPLKIMIGDNTYKDRIEISPEEVYRELDHSKTTSTQPSVNEITQFLDDIKEAGYSDVFAITLSSGLSGTNNAFRLALEQYEGLNYHLFDSKTLSMALGFMVMEASKLAKIGTAFEQIAEKMSELRFKKISCFYTINTLTYLRRGGRIGKVEGTIAELLDIKPIISVNDAGVYYSYTKTRGERKAISKMVDLIKEKYSDKKIQLAVLYGNNFSVAKSIQKKINDFCKVKENYIWQLSPVLGMHTGPSLLAVIACEE